MTNPTEAQAPAAPGKKPSLDEIEKAGEILPCNCGAPRRYDVEHAPWCQTLARYRVACLLAVERIALEKRVAELEEEVWCAHLEEQESEDARQSAVAVLAAAHQRISELERRNEQHVIAYDELARDRDAAHKRAAELERMLSEADAVIAHEEWIRYSVDCDEDNAVEPNCSETAWEEALTRHKVRVALPLPPAGEKE